MPDSSLQEKISELNIDIRLVWVVKKQHYIK